MTYKWRQLHIRGWGPASGHTCVEIEPGRLLVLGGESDDGKPMGMTLYHIDYATAADVPVVEVHKGTLACGPIILADNFDAGGAGAENSAWQQRDSVFGGLRGVANQTPESRSLHSFNELLLGLSCSLSGTRTGSIDDQTIDVFIWLRDPSGGWVWFEGCCAEVWCMHVQRLTRSLMY